MRIARNLAAKLTGFVFLCLSALPSSAQDPGTNAALIDIGLARHVAAAHVQANNRPYLWRYLGHMVLYDVYGNTNAYAFVFGKDESRFKAPRDLRQHIIDSMPPSSQSKEPSEDSDLFAFDDLATVIAGATDESPLILRHFRGAPEFWIEAVKIDKSRRTSTSAATKVIMVTPMDFRLVSTEAIATTAVASEKQAAGTPLSPSAETVAVHSKKAERISALRQQAEDRQTRTRKRFEAMRTEQRQWHEAAQQERKVFLRDQWDSKRTEWENAKQPGEEQR